MSNQTKAKIVAVEKCTDEELLVLMIASTGGTAPGIKAYEVFAKLDEKGHTGASFRHTFSALAVKAKELIARHPDVELIDGVVPATPRKRKATTDDGETGEGGEDGATSASVVGKKAPAAGRKRKATTDDGETGEGGEDGATSASAVGKKAPAAGRKRKAVKSEEAGEGGEDGATSASGGGKRAKVMQKAKVGAKKGGKKVVGGEKVTTQGAVEEEGLGQMVFTQKPGRT